MTLTRLPVEPTRLRPPGPLTEPEPPADTEFLIELHVEPDRELRSLAVLLGASHVCVV